MADPNDTPRNYTPEAASRALKSKFGISKSVSVQDILDHVVDGNLVFVHVLHDGTRQPFSPWEAEVYRNAHDQGRATKLHPYIEAAELERFALTLKTQKRPTEEPDILRSLYKVLLVLAVEVYKYDPQKQRNHAAEDIANKAYFLSKKAQCDLEIDPKTVNKRLREAAEALHYLPPKK
ncbi:MAG: hypothetical protein ACREV3_02710 [Gammaproteobacteria bacterium]